MIAKVVKIAIGDSKDIGFERRYIYTIKRIELQCYISELKQ